ncbi:type II toxin-antitoxin system Phd/YefM family antitoxin [Paracraurococcus ruber]|uniref:Antitoxin n=1 Tax=Paracraurococcus ruber TaxID=77675 RepID=A0ABS1D5B0_9PROT|nr:prevent-host-death protein [Paracraurococcus ruber]MBK1661660.1 hypothetical protein [Paracraurococcus ruber]TDG26621.1 prevent-host-death protein [Paracraurococcus ruber]
MDPQAPPAPPEDVPPRRVAVREFRGNLASCLQEVQEGGSLLITSRGQVVAELRPPPSGGAPRPRPDGPKGRIAVAPDFDAPPPDRRAPKEGEEEA